MRDLNSDEIGEQSTIKEIHNEWKPEAHEHGNFIQEFVTRLLFIVWLEDLRNEKNN